MPAKKKIWISGLSALAVIIAGIVFYSTKAKTIEPDTFVKFYADYLIAQDTLGTDVVSSKKIRAQLYKKYSVTNEEYLSTINNYNSDQKKWAEFFEKVTKHLEERQKTSKVKK